MRKLGLLTSLLLAVGLWADSLSAQNQLDSIAERAKVRYTNVPRKVLAFYYPWYGNPDQKAGSGRWSHWDNVDQAAERIGSSTHYPELGPYDSHDPELIDLHCAWAKQAGVDGFIASWSDHFLERMARGQ